MDGAKPFRVVEAAFDGAVNSVSVSSSQQVFAIGDENGEGKIFNYENGSFFAQAQGHCSSVTKVVIAPSDKLMVTGDAKGNIFLWRL